MNKLFTLAAICLMMVSCSQQPVQQSSCVDADAVMTDLIMSRRSIRQYQDITISRDTLDAILQCGINAPNGRGIQAYEVRVIDSPALLDSITQAVLQDNPKIGERPGFRNIFVNAPCVVFIASYKDYDMSEVDCGLLGENIILSAWAKGIGSCCLGSSARMMKESQSAKPYLDRLGFSNGYELLYCIGLGYPAESPAQKPRSAEKIKYID